jgi:hypothetical protein
MNKDKFAHILVPVPSGGALAENAEIPLNLGRLCLQDSKFKYAYGRWETDVLPKCKECEEWFGVNPDE